MNTITRQFLQAQVDRLNRATDSPMESSTRDEQGKYKSNVGNYHLSGAYGGVSLHRMENESGGVSDVFRCGHITKRDLSERISAMLVGIESPDLSQNTALLARVRELEEVLKDIRFIARKSISMEDVTEIGKIADFELAKSTTQPRDLSAAALRCH